MPKWLWALISLPFPILMDSLIIIFILFRRIIIIIIIHLFLIVPPLARSLARTLIRALCSLTHAPTHCPDHSSTHRLTCLIPYPLTHLNEQGWKTETTTKDEKDRTYCRKVSC